MTQPRDFGDHVSGTQANGIHVTYLVLSDLSLLERELLVEEPAELLVPEL